MEAKWYYELCVATLSETSLSEEDRYLLENIMSVWKLLSILYSTDEAKQGDEDIQHIRGVLEWLQWHAETLETQEPDSSLYSMIRRGQKAASRFESDTDKKILSLVVAEGVREQVRGVIRAGRQGYENGGRGELLSLASGLGMEEYVDKRKPFDVLWTLVWAIKQYLVSEGESIGEVLDNAYIRYCNYLCISSGSSRGSSRGSSSSTKILELISSIIFRMPVDKILVENMLPWSESLEVDCNTVHSFLGYLGGYLRSSLSLFDPEICEVVDVLVERSIMSFFASKGVAVAEGQGAGFLAEHVVAIYGVDRRIRVWTGCLIELCHTSPYSAPLQQGRYRRIIEEMITREEDYVVVVGGVMRLVVEEVSELSSSAVGSAVEILGMITLLSLRKFPNRKTIYGVFEELLERLAVGVLLTGTWEEMWDVVSSSLDVGVVMEGGNVTGGGWIKLIKLCHEAGLLSRGVVVGVEEIVDKLGFGERKAMVSCHSKDEEEALARGIEYVLRKVVEKGDKRQVMEVVDKCEHSEWLCDVLGDKKWKHLGELCDRVLQ